MSDDLSSAIKPTEPLADSLESAAPSDKSVSPPIRGREVVGAIVWMVLADLLVFRSAGYSGPAVFLSLVPILFVVLFPGMWRQRSAWWTAGVLAVVALRLVWLGSALSVFSGVVLIIATAMVAAGSVPLVLEGVVVAVRSFFDGAISLGQFQLSKHLGREGRVSGGSLAVMLPAVAACVFGSIFVLANPDLLDRVSSVLSDWGSSLIRWFSGFSVWELPFCVAALLIGAGLIRPARAIIPFGSPTSSTPMPKASTASHWYPAFRNTLITVIALFLMYLFFEWATLWKRDFPAGFYYAGYAHQGAAWLTFALALATGMLSLIFRGSILADPRLSSLKQLAWIWSAANFGLALAVYNRLFIYVGYNGMTRMRMVGLFGISLVIVGFVLVVYKIGRHRNFWWLIRSQLIALVLVVIVYSVFPVDYVAHRYNAGRVAAGSLRPSVMIAVKPINDEGMLTLLELLDCPDPTIRRGVRALLARRQSEIAPERDPIGWTGFQGSRRWLRSRLQANESGWSEFVDSRSQQKAIDDFREYAMQWY